MRSNKDSAIWIVVLALFTVTLLATSRRAAAQTEEVLHSFNVGGTDGFEPNGKVIFDGATHLYGTTPDGGTGGHGTVFELAEKNGVWSETTPHPFDFNGTDGSFPYSGLLLHAGKLYGTTQYGGLFGYGTVFELTYTTGTGWAQTFTYSFGLATNDGQNPNSGLIWANGSIYGTTGSGGSNLNCGTSGESVGCGTVFELTPPAPGGAWAYSVVYNFGNNSGSIPDGQIPVGLVFHGGEFYGVTQDGGQYGEGRVFELDPITWVETVVHDFTANDGLNTDGAVPNFGLTVNSSGDLYGTTSQGGTHNNGVVFEITSLLIKVGRTYERVWIDTVLHDFENSVDGAYPSGLILDKSGNVYGTTLEGGANNGGTAFELLVGSSVPWTEAVLYNFCGVSVGPQNCTDGQFPSSGLTFDNAGNVYGTTSQGGAFGWGTVFAIISNNFALSASSNILSITQGTGASSTILVAGIGSFAGTVNLRASGLPKGVTASFSPSSVSVSGSGASTLTLTASATAKIESGATVTINGTSGTLQQSTTIVLTVSP
jgi:uncharacterized repeat protein (TIGR03803 family)